MDSEQKSRYSLFFQNVCCSMLITKDLFRQTILSECSCYRLTTCKMYLNQILCYRGYVLQLRHIIRNYNSQSSFLSKIIQLLNSWINVYYQNIHYISLAHNALNFISGNYLNLRKTHIYIVVIDDCNSKGVIFMTDVIR